MIHWFTYDANYNTTTSLTLNVEFNIRFFLVDNPNFQSSFTTLFDQYCIFAVFVRVIPAYVPGASATLTQNYYTAIDYDSDNLITTPLAIQAFQSVQSSDYSVTQERYIEPCVRDVVNTTGTSTVIGGVRRTWVDSAATNVGHYGFRSIYEPTTTLVPITVKATFVVCGRNSF